MKLATIAAALLAAITATAQDAALPAVLTTLYADGSTNTWTQADLVDALGMMNRKYHRDMQSEKGRQDWHGALTQSGIIATNEAGVVVSRSVYADGYIHEEPFRAKPVRPATAEDNGEALRRANLRKREAELRQTIASTEVSSLEHALAVVELARVLRMIERETAPKTKSVRVVTTP